MDLINLSSRTRNTEYFDRSHDMETALAWNAVKKSLAEAGREDLFAYIKSVKVTEKYITITTHKPIVNAEIKLYSEDICSRFHGSMKLFGEQKIMKKVRLG